MNIFVTGGQRVKTLFVAFFQFWMRPTYTDTISQFSTESSTSADSKEPTFITASDIRRRLSENIAAPKTKFEVGLIYSK